MIDVPDVMRALASQRKAYHSEADFQHAFAWEVHSRLPYSSVRLERPLRTNGKVLHLDFLIQLPNAAIAVELKYKTRELVVDIENETFSLASHAAQDLGRYDFIKDICRLENITSSLGNCHGYAILLTNDSAYWKPGRNGTVDEAFRLNEGRILSGSLSWTDKASDGTKRNREKELHLTGIYELNWQDFSVIDADRYCQFRYVAVPVSG